MKKRFPVKLFSVLYGLLLTGFSLYVILDCFVIPHRYVAAEGRSLDSGRVAASARDDKENDRVAASAQDDKENGRVSDSGRDDMKNGNSEDNGSGAGENGAAPEKQSSEETVSEDVVVSDNSSESVSENEAMEEEPEEEDDGPWDYEEDGIKVRMAEYREYDTDIHVAEIKISDPACLKTAFAEDTYGRNVNAPVSVIAKEKEAVLAINGDFYGSRQTGYVIRNSVLYRDEPESGNEDLVIYEDGSFAIVNEDMVTAQELLEDGAAQVFSFGPALIEEGSISVRAGQEVGRAMHSNPRTAIGIMGPGHYIFLVSDGRTDENAGMSLLQLAEFMETLDVETAYNLDGGGSSTMIFMDELKNQPTGGGGYIAERSVSDIVYIGR
ncbi:MAG: phosphodiester glycosidase family protein [Lachnospiraceae bacterium]|nr:phosphodiester glycosidase family protein [Lachnospiraceae bacterium]